MRNLIEKFRNAVTRPMAYAIGYFVGSMTAMWQERVRVGQIIVMKVKIVIIKIKLWIEGEL